MGNQKKYNTFRQTFPEFVYDSYQYDVRPDGLHIVFRFQALGVNGSATVAYEPSAFIPKRPFLHLEQPRENMDRLVFNIGMIELISYWKAFCSPSVEVRCGSLDDNQVAFWKKLYFNGLGEFFYTNGIQAGIDDFLDLKSTAVSSSSPFSIPNSQLSFSNYLVPVGGGKDSVVTLESLKQSGRVVPLVMNPRGATRQCCEVAGFGMDDVLVIERRLDPKLLEMNSKGALNGHTPFSAMLAFYTLLASQLAAIANVALSNESSANESTVVGTYVNHQYSKSVEFEDDFREYVRQSMGVATRYFSFLRPLSELQIAMLFARHSDYFGVFKSCNVGSKEDKWCGHCAKCLFAFIILSPFVHPAQLQLAFGKNMLDDMSMKQEFDELVGVAATKPFECVGTISEVNQALAMCHRRWYAENAPALLRYWLYDLAPKVTAPPIRLEDFYTEHHNLTSTESQLLRRALSVLS